jgi:hypothetical protein
VRLEGIVRHFLPRIREVLVAAHRADVPADPEGGAAVRVSPAVPEITVPSGPGAKDGAVAAVCPIPARFSIHVICLAALFWTLVLGQPSLADSHPARGRSLPRLGPTRGARALKFVTHCRWRVTGLERGSTLYSDKDHSGSFAIDSADDPNDDETSDDPNDDDDAWDNLTADNDTDVRITVWLPEMVRYLIDLEVGFAPASLHSLPAHFPTLQRLRC